MAKSKTTMTRSSQELAEALGLTPADGAEIELRSELNDKIISIVKSKKLTHLQVAQLSGTSRTRITALLNRNSQNVSTDLMLRILTNLGYRARLTFHKAA